jgi:hypothetical protein
MNPHAPVIARLKMGRADKEIAGVRHVFDERPRSAEGQYVL